MPKLGSLATIAQQPETPGWVPLSDQHSQRRARLPRLHATTAELRFLAEHPLLRTQTTQQQTLSLSAARAIDVPDLNAEITRQLRLIGAAQEQIRPIEGPLAAVMAGYLGNLARVLIWEAAFPGEMAEDARPERGLPSVTFGPALDNLTRKAERPQDVLAGVNLWYSPDHAIRIISYYIDCYPSVNQAFQTYRAAQTKNSQIRI